MRSAALTRIKKLWVTYTFSELKNYKYIMYICLHLWQGGGTLCTPMTFQRTTEDLISFHLWFTFDTQTVYSSSIGNVKETKDSLKAKMWMSSAETIKLTFNDLPMPHLPFHLNSITCSWYCNQIIPFHLNSITCSWYCNQITHLQI